MDSRFVDLVSGSNRKTDQLQFSIQSDFLLIANREDIDSSSIWNHCLLEAIPRAFLDVVQEFNNGDM